MQLVGDGLSLRVERRARVPAAAVARHLLQHQALVAVEHARAGVVCERPLLEKKRHFRTSVACFSYTYVWVSFIPNYNSNVIATLGSDISDTADTKWKR